MLGILLELAGVNYDIFEKSAIVKPLGKKLCNEHQDLTCMCDVDTVYSLLLHIFFFCTADVNMTQ